MERFLQELGSGLPGWEQIGRVMGRLVVAAVLSGIIGIQRERAGKPAGLRTHMLVAIGAAMFVLAATESGMPTAEASRIIQGVATGIGFIGAGAILKGKDEQEITGLTTAAGIWMTAAVGVTAALGLWGLATVSVLMSWLILSVVGALEGRMERQSEAAGKQRDRG